MQLPLPSVDRELPAEAPVPLAPDQRIYCNRSTRLDQVDVIGFDMDYTLAVYREEPMDRLGVEATVEKLIERGYPASLRAVELPSRFPIRGLLVDRKLGNVLKMDRYKYVKRAYHGLRELTREERREAYHRRQLRRKSPRYHWVDTLYALPEVTVYAATIHHLESLGSAVDYDRLFGDVRECIDRAHQDGSILDRVAANLDAYVTRDPELATALHKLRSAGKRLFLLTNSQPDYTDRMMTYLLGRARADYPSWRNYFDYVITAARKPRFFTERTPFVDVERSHPVEEHLDRGRIYAGGNLADLQRMLDVGDDRVLYVGDHIYGDVLRAKKETAWRTAMIVQEMTAESAVLDAASADIRRFDALAELRDQLHDDLRDRQLRLKAVERKLASGSSPELDAARVRHRRSIDHLRLRLRAVELEHDHLAQDLEGRFHPYWGSLFKAGPELSTFGQQVETYACLYTSRVSNFGRYSPTHFFQRPRDRMPHEL